MLTEETVSTEPLATRASRAVALLAILSLATRVLLVASNWILGALLSQESFGVNGLVGVVVSTAWAFVGFGLDDVLVQRRGSMRLWEATARRGTLLVAFGTAAIVCALAPVAAWAFREPLVIGPILVAATSFPLAALSIVPAAKLTSRMDFNFLMTWGAIEIGIIQGLTIVLAFLDFGAYSFAIPVPIAVGIRAIVYHWRAPMERKSRVHRPQRMKQLLLKGAPAAGSKFINMLVGFGDSLILGLLTSTIVVGYYFFAFRIASAPVRLAATSLSTVLFPAMTTFRSDPKRQSEAAIKAATLLTWIISPFCYYQIVIAGPVLHFFFGDKWAASIPIVQLLSIGLAIEGIMAVTRSYLSAAGKFRTSFNYSLANGAGFFAACAIGAVLGSGVGVAMAVSTYYLLTQPPLFAYLVDHTGQRLKNFIRIFITPSIASSISFAIAWLAFRTVGEPLTQAALVTLVGWPLFVLAFWIAAPDVFRQFLGMVIGLVGKRFRRSTPKA